MHLYILHYAQFGLYAYLDPHKDIKTNDNFLGLVWLKRDT